MGSSVGSFFYDFASLRDALKRERFDIIYEAGYTSIVPAYIWFNVKNIRHPVFTTNMDGLEYKRTKFNRWVRKFVFWEERMTVKHSHYLIADNMGIHDYYKEKYGKESKFLAYGADIHEDYNPEFLKEFGLEENGYYLLVARLEPENNIAMAIDGYLASEENGRRPLVIVGKPILLMAKSWWPGMVKSGRYVSSVAFMISKAELHTKILFGLFHGHSVGGTNPSLLEAMASGCFILANDNLFNRAVLKHHAEYYSTPAEVTGLLNDMAAYVVRDKENLSRQI